MWPVVRDKVSNVRITAVTNTNTGGADTAVSTCGHVFELMFRTGGGTMLREHQRRSGKQRNIQFRVVRQAQLCNISQPCRINFSWQWVFTV